MIAALTHVRDWQKFISRDLHATEIACLPRVYPEALCLDGSVCHGGPRRRAVVAVADIRLPWPPSRRRNIGHRCKVSRLQTGLMALEMIQRVREGPIIFASQPRRASIKRQLLRHAFNVFPTPNTLLKLTRAPTYRDRDKRFSTCRDLSCR